MTDLTPPVLFIGDNLVVGKTKIPALIVPLDTKFGNIEINLALQDNRK